MSRSILFIDDICPQSYDETSLKERVVGGTEATVIRVATGLAALGHRVHVKIAASTRGSHWFGSQLPSFEPDVVVVLRQPEQLPKYRLIYPKARLYLWLHDLMGFHHWESERYILESEARLICVSDYHRRHSGVVFCNGLSSIEIATIYNPIDDELARDATPVDAKKLIYFSQPAKGLGYTLQIFEKLRCIDPSFTLYVARPNYCSDYPLPSHVVNLGSLPYLKVLEHVRSSLGVLYINRDYPETFGLVMAEANGVGTPVLTHPIGSAKEVLGDDRQWIDTRDEAAVIDRLIAWSNGQRPDVQAKSAFRLSSVLERWRDLIQS